MERGVRCVPIGVFFRERRYGFSGCVPGSESLVLFGTLLHEEAHLCFVLVRDPVVVSHVDIPSFLDLASIAAAPL